MTGALLGAEHLTRTFDARVAVRDLSFSVDAGEVVALLGPNGAGKTTTLRMLAGLLSPTAGRIVINRIVVSPSTAGRARGDVGFLTEAPGLWERLSVRLNLVTYARLQGLPAPEKRVDEVLSIVGVADRSAEVAGRLSKGLKQRVALARALVHRPSVLLLDEPTAGLDPASARQVRDLIRHLRGEGRAILVSTHNLTEAEELSDRIAVLNSRLLALETPAALRQEVGGYRVGIRVEGDAAPWAIVAQRLDGATAIADGGRLAIRLPDEGDVPDLVALLVGAGARILSVGADQRTLEEVYLDLVRGE